MAKLKVGKKVTKVKKAASTSGATPGGTAENFAQAASLALSTLGKKGGRLLGGLGLAAAAYPLVEGVTGLGIEAITGEKAAERGLVEEQIKTERTSSAALLKHLREQEATRREEMARAERQTLAGRRLELTLAANEARLGDTGVGNRMRELQELFSIAPAASAQTTAVLDAIAQRVAAGRPVTPLNALGLML